MFLQMYVQVSRLIQLWAFWVIQVFEYDVFLSQIGEINKETKKKISELCFKINASHYVFEKSLKTSK